MEHRLFVILALALGIQACGPVTYQQKTVVWEPYEEAETRQRKENVTVDVSFVEELPPSFSTQVPACNEYGMIESDAYGNPKMESVSLGTNDQVWQKVAVTNGTGNVIRLNGVVIRLFDPAANQYPALTSDDLQVELLSKRPCSTTQQALNLFRVNPIFNRNIEIVPGTSSTFWVAFKPATRMMPGVWKFALYDVPVAVDPAGRPTRTTQFETRLAVKEVVDTYYRENAIAPAVLIERTETGADGQLSTTRYDSNQSAMPQQANTPVAPTTAGAATPVSKSTTASAQRRLNELGFDAGAPDGVAGPKTRTAIERFQRANKIYATGKLDAQTLSALGM